MNAAEQVSKTRNPGCAMLQESQTHQQQRAKTLHLEGSIFSPALEEVLHVRGGGICLRGEIHTTTVCISTWRGMLTNATDPPLACLIHPSLHAFHTLTHPLLGLLPGALQRW
jgi:hypothetical protein